MLKIIKNIDLKELEKYGFELADWGGCWIGGNSNRELHLNVYTDTREIEMCEPFREVEGDENNIELLYDLIKDGLVEKVEE